MSIECVPSNLSSDVRCTVCGQGFLVYGDRGASRERVAVRETVQTALRQQHAGSDHPTDGFHIDWKTDNVR